MFKENINWDEIRIIEFYGIRRSGNHAILSWLMNNLNTDGSGPQDPEILIAPHPEVGFISQRVGNVYHLNDLASSWSWYSPKYIRGLMEAYASVGAKTIILSYEECSPYMSLATTYPELFPFMQDENREKWAAIRNWDQVVASRCKATQDPNKKRIAFKVGDGIITSFLNTVYHPTAIKVHFDSWVKHKRYRDLVAWNSKLPNIDHTSHVSNAGGGPSFQGGDVTKRTIEAVPRDWRQALAKNAEELKEAQERIDTYISFKPQN